MPSPAKRNANISQGFEAFFKGAPEGCIRLTVGEPDFPTPKEVVEAAKADLDAGDTHYVATAGKQVLLEAIQEKLTRVNRSRLARECAKLDPKFEKALAEEGLSQDVGGWPEY